MPYTRTNIKNLLKENLNNNIEVLIHCGGDYQWIMLSEGVLKTNTIIFDHRYLGDELGVEKHDWATKPYLGNNDGCVI